MAKAKYKKYFEEMFAQNRELFLKFKLVNDDYGKNREKYKEEFDQVGSQVLVIVKDWERRLCGHMEKGENAMFSSNVAEKYYEEIRKYFPYFDQIGVKIRKVKI
jgi:hypothetical protein